jgi:hypothetical protein
MKDVTGGSAATAEPSSGAASSCPGCGVTLPVVEGTAHPYMTCTPACWAVYGRVLAAQYEQPERMRFHQLVVDSYAVQHPGTGSDPRAVQSVGIHLMTLCLFLEHGTDPALGATLHRRMVERPVFHLLQAPTHRGTFTCSDIPVSGSAERAREAVYDWARSVWAAWSTHHEVVREWLTISGLLPTRSTRR